MAEIALVLLGVVAVDDAAALRADALGGAVPGHEGAGRVLFAAVIAVPALGLLLEQLGAADRAGHARVLGERLGVLAFRIARAGEELAETAVFDDHVAAAALADDVGHLVGDLDALFVEVLLGLLQLAGEAVVKAAQHGAVIGPAVLDLVELILHRGGELDVDDVVELVDHQVGDGDAEARRAQAAPVLDDVFAVEDDRDGRGIGARPADAALLHRPDQARLGVARRGLGEVLLRVDAAVFGAVAGAQGGQLAAVLVVARLVEALLIEGEEAREGDALAGGAELPVGAGQGGGGGVEHGVAHLAGQEARPDQLVEPELVWRQAAPEAVGVEGGVARADGLVGVLGVLLGLEDAGAPGLVVGAEAAVDEAARRRHRLVGDAQGVGAHVGDQTGQAGALQLDALIQLLRHRHGALGGHAQLARGLLLKGRGDEGRRRLAALLGLFDVGDRVDAVADVGEDAVGRRLVGQLDLALAVAVEMGQEVAAVLGEPDVDGPVFLRLEGLDLALAVHDHAGDDALHAPGGQAGAHLAPQEGRELVADDAVEDAARLLRVDQVHVDVARLLHRLGDGVLRDLVEGHAARLAVRQVEQLAQVPGDGLALAVRVGGEIDAVGLVGGGAQLADDLVLALDGLVIGREIVVDVNAQRLFRQIAQVAHRGLDLVIAAQILGDGFGLGGGFDNQQLCHVYLQI